MKIMFKMLSFVIFILFFSFLLSACSNDEIMMSISETSVVIETEQINLPSIKINNKEFSWTEFDYLNDDNYVYVYNGQIYLTEKSPDEFETILKVIYKKNNSVFSEINVINHYTEIESIVVEKRSRRVYPGEWVNYRVSSLPINSILRNYNDYVLIGGLDHRTGRVNSNNKYKRMQEIAEKYFNNSEISHFWTANDCITYDAVPLVGRFEKKNKDVFVITGFNKWGMANSMISSLIISDLIAEQKNEFVNLFSLLRLRFSLTGFLSSVDVSVKYLIGKRLCLPIKSYKKLKNNQGEIVDCCGKKAVYKDDDGKYHVNNPYCKHMGCEMKFNPNVNTWDCPCHGSRFTMDGKIITGPTVYDLNNYNDKFNNNNKKSKKEK